MEDSAYIVIAQKIEDQEPQTAPKAEDGSIHKAFISHLKLIYTPEEAEIARHLNLLDNFTSTQELADATGKSLEYIEKILEDIHLKHGVVGLENLYCLPPITLIVNSHSFDPEVKPDDIEAARLYQEYFIRGNYYKYYESSKKGTPMARVIPVNRAIEANQRVLAAEEAHDYILNHASEELSLVPCPCRTRTEKMGIRECKDKFPVGACIMLGLSVGHFETTTNISKRVTKQQAIQYFDEMQELGLVGQTVNAVYGDMIICLCCGCCCSHVRGRTRWDNPNSLSPSNFVPRAGEDCIGCGTCTERCFFGAISLDEETDQVQVNVDKCIGCGVCTLACPQETLKLHRYERSTPFETTQQLFETARRENRE